MTHEEAVWSKSFPGSVFTIGHSNLTAEAFEGLLRKFGIELVLDVRSYPNAQYSPRFKGEYLEKKLEGEGVHCILLNGCQGDTNHFDLSRPKPSASTAERYQKVTRRMGEIIAEAALEIWDEGKPMVEGPVSGEVSLHAIPSNLEGLDEIEEAKEIQKLLAARLPTPRPLNLAERGRYARISRMENLALFQKTL